MKELPPFKRGPKGHPTRMVAGVEEKWCGICEQFKPLSEYLFSGGKPKLPCRQCRTDYHRMWRAEHREQMRQYRREYYRRAKARAEGREELRARVYEKGTNPKLDAMLAYYPDATLYVVTGDKGMRYIWVDNHVKRKAQCAKTKYKWDQS